jgi:hypothetical protein
MGNIFQGSCRVGGGHEEKIVAIKTRGAEVRSGCAKIGEQFFQVSDLAAEKYPIGVLRELNI